MFELLFALFGVGVIAGAVSGIRSNKKEKKKSQKQDYTNYNNSSSSNEYFSYLDEQEKTEREEKERDEREEREYIKELDSFFNRVSSDINYWRINYDPEEDDFSKIGRILPPAKVLEDIDFDRWSSDTTYDILREMEFSYVIPENYRIRAGAYARDYEKIRDGKY